MGRDDEPVDPMEIDGQQKLQVEASTAVPEGFNADYLRVYYGKLFPYSDFFKWLCYGNDGKHPGCDQSYVGRREFSFTLENDIYLRFQSFDSAAELESSIKEKCPFKIDIGPVYSVDPAKRHAYAQSGNNVFVPVERELIFDIDISDYDDVRYCCSGADVCLECWPLMTIAIKILDTSLRDDFGFNHILWVYSGRRGVHCWVCDSRARKLSNEQRTAVADYFRVYKGGENAQKKVSLAGPVLHPFLARSYTDVLESFFEDKLLLSQQLFASEDRCQKILDLIPDENVASELHDKWQGNRRSSVSKEDVNAARWKQLKTTLQSGKHKAQGLRRCVEEIVFSYTYPRLDMEVSKHMNHLLKAPFCIHPKTGRVCVPIDPNNCEDFDPTAVPTLSQLLGELNAAGFQTDSENNWERTSLEKSIRFFRTSFLQPLLKACKEELESAYNAKLQQSKNSLNCEEEAKKKIYSVCTTTYTGFGALISEELSYKVKGLPGVLWVLPDSYLDVPNKDYGGDLFVDGKVIHRPQFRFTERQQVRSRPRPRHDRRRDTVQVDRRETMQRGPPTQQQQRPPFPQEAAQHPQQHYETMPPGVGK